MRREELRESMEEAKALPSLPGLVVRLLNVTQDETSHVDELAHIIESDAGMTARVLKLANSSLYNPRIPVTTVQRAVATMGYRAVRCMALGMGMARTFPAKNGNEGFSFEEFWKHSLACGVSARMLAQKMKGEVDPDEAFMAGLLHDLGRAMLATLHPVEYAQVLRRMRETGDPLLLCEEHVFGASHAEAGKWLAEQWGLPELLSQVIWLHHQPPGTLAAPYFHARMIYLVQLSDWLAHRMMIGTPHRETWSESNALLLREAGAEAQWLPEIQAALMPKLKEYAPLVELDCDPNDMYLESLQRANGALSDLGLRIEREGRRLARRERRFCALHQMNSQVSLKRTLPEILNAIITALRDGFDVSAGLCALPRQQGQVLWGKVWDSGNPKEFQLPLNEPAEGALLPGLLGEQAVRQWLSETSHHWNNGGRPLVGAEEVARRGPRFLMPMLLDSTTVGYVLADLHHWAEADQEDPGLDELLALCSAGALAISRVNLIHKLDRRSEELASAMWKKEQIQKQLLHSERLAAVGKMAAGAAHEVNNPLAIISGRAQILLQHEASSAGQKQLNVIIDQAARASKILNDLMRFARPTLPQKEKCRVNAVVAEVMEMFETQFRNHGIELRADYGEGLPRVLVDRKQIQQVLVNLLINAEHAIDKTGAITVRTYANAAQDRVHIDVTDSGCGIPSDQLAKIFEPFFTTKEEGKGTGLGLSLAHGIVTSHQGTINVRSSVGAGSTFIISLPMAQDLPAAEETPPPAAAPRQESAPTARTRRILVVDDEEQVRDIIAEALEGAGYQITQATNGAEALEAVQLNPPDLITLDIRMPRMDGMTMLRALRERYPQLPVIVITGLAMEEEVNAAQTLGIAAFFRKPFEVGQLLEAVQAALSQ